MGQCREVCGLSFPTDGTGVKEMWKANELPPDNEREYGFTHFAMRLNEPDQSELKQYPPPGGTYSPP